MEALQDLNTYRSELERGDVMGYDYEFFPTAEAMYKLVSSTFSNTSTFDWPFECFL